MDQNVAYFFVLFTFAASILIPYGLSKRWSVAIEFIIPAYACCYALFILPTFWWNGKYKKFLTGKALYQVLNIGYISDFIMSCFLSSQYLTSFLSRTFMIGLFVNLFMHRIIDEHGDIVPVLVNFFLIIAINETNFYNSNLK